MPPVNAFRISGLEIDFLSNDHWPPHFHVTLRGEWEIRVFILTTTDDRLHYEIKWPKKAAAGPNGKIQRALRKHVVRHRQDLIREYNNKVDYNPPSQP